MRMPPQGRSSNRRLASERRTTSARAALTSMSVGFASIISNLALLPLILSTVGAADYGVWITLITATTYLYQADLGAGAAVVHFGSQARGGGGPLKLNQLVASSCAWMASITGLLIPLYITVAAVLLNHTSLGSSLTAEERNWFIVLGALILACFPLRTFSATLESAGYWTTERHSQLLGVAVRSVGIILACSLDVGVAGIASAEALGLIVPPMVSTLACLLRRIARPHRRDVSLNAVRVILRYSTRSFAVAAIGALILQSGSLIATTTIGPASAAYYNAAFRVYSSARQLVSWTIDPLRPALSRMYVLDAAEAMRIVRGALFLMQFLVTAGSGFLIFVMPVMIEPWLGDSVPTRDVTLTIQVLLAGLIVNCAHIPLMAATDSAGFPGAYLKLQATWCVLTLIFGVALANAIGIVGIGLGLTVSIVLLEPFYLIKAQRALGFPLRNWLTETATNISALGFLGALTGIAISASPLPDLWRHISAGLALVSVMLVLALLTRKRLPVSLVKAAVSARV
jgi:O-antigen/teichoic acid export membrane protein